MSERVTRPNNPLICFHKGKENTNLKRAFWIQTKWNYCNVTLITISLLEPLLKFHELVDVIVFF